jgi:hypothetical protein
MLTAARPGHGPVGRFSYWARPAGQGRGPNAAHALFQDFFFQIPSGLKLAENCITSKMHRKYGKSQKNTK